MVMRVDGIPDERQPLSVGVQVVVDVSGVLVLHVRPNVLVVENYVDRCIRKVGVVLNFRTCGGIVKLLYRQQMFILSIRLLHLVLQLFFLEETSFMCYLCLDKILSPV